jgi:WD40 repeat protein
VNAAAFSPDGTKLATAGEDGLQLWDVPARSRTARWGIDKAVLTAVAFGPKGDCVLVGTADGRATRWDLASGRPLGSWMMHPGEVDDAAFSADGKTLTTRSGRRLRAWAADAGGERDFTLPGYYPNARLAEFTRDGRELITVDSTPNEVRRWDVRTLKPAGEAMKPPSPLMASLFLMSPDRSVALIADYAKSARLWDLNGGKFIGAPLALGGPAETAAFSPNGDAVAIAFGKGSVQLWNARTGGLLGAPLAHDKEVRDVVFSPDSSLVLTASDDGTARLWDARTGAPAGAPLRQTGGVWSAAFSPDGKYIATASGKAARRWDARTLAPAGAPMSTTAPVMRVAFSPDGKTILTVGGDFKVRLWDAATGEPRGKALAHESFVYAASFSPDSKTVLTGSWDKTARLWDGRTGEPLGQPFRHDVGVTFADFSPDGRTVVSGGGESGVVRLWDVSWLGAAPSPKDMLADAEKVTLRRLNDRGDVEAVPEEP